MEPMEPIPEEEDFASTATSYSSIMAHQQQQNLRQISTSPSGSSTHTILKQPGMDGTIKNAKNNDFGGIRKIESKQRQREIYTTEEVDTLVSTLPKESIPDEWNRFSSEEVIVDPNMAHTYVTEIVGGQPSARGTKYSYTYETHLDEPEATTAIPYESYHENTHLRQNYSTDFPDYVTVSQMPESDLERYSTSTQKVTRVTKITTTRSVKQIPVNPDDIFFDADGNPILNGYDAQHLSEYEGDEGIGIDLSRTYISEHEEYSSPASSSTTAAGATFINNPPPPQPQPETMMHLNRENGNFIYDDSEYFNAVPGAPGVPEVIDLSDANISLAWLRPERDGTGGEILGYRVQFRRSELEPWEPAHDDLLGETECKITNLDPQDSYYFRVLAANSAGFGYPSISSPAIRLRNASTISDTNPQGFLHNGPTPIESDFDGNNDYLMRSPLPPPQRLRILEIDGDRVLLEWHYLAEHEEWIRQTSEIKIIGYGVEYRAAGTSVRNLRPNGEYEFRILAKDSEGSWTRASASTGIVRIRPAVPQRTQQNLIGASPYDEFNPILRPPGQPQVVEADANRILLRWSEGGQLATQMPQQLGYLVECRQVGDIQWDILNPMDSQQKISYPMENQFIVENLHPEISYEFRVSTVSLLDGSRSLPSETSEVFRLRAVPPQQSQPTTSYFPSSPNFGIDSETSVQKLPPQRPQPPEYLDFDETDGSSLTLCWLPAQSQLPVLGYEVEFRDVMQDATRWYKLTDQLIRTFGYLIHSHQYQFRILAKNAAGYSPPSDPSPLITIGGSTMKETKYIEAERHAAVALLQEEMVRESPPLPDRDDSPPPIYRQPAGSMHWRDPTLKEVIDYLKSSDQAVVQDASGYLQHLTYNNDALKEETRNYGIHFNIYLYV